MEKKSIQRKSLLQGTRAVHNFPELLLRQMVIKTVFAIQYHVNSIHSAIARALKTLHYAAGEEDGSGVLLDQAG